VAFLARPYLCRITRDLVQSGLEKSGYGRHGICWVCRVRSQLLPRYCKYPFPISIGVADEQQLDQPNVTSAVAAFTVG